MSLTLVWRRNENSTDTDEVAEGKNGNYRIKREGTLFSLYRGETCIATELAPIEAMRFAQRDNDILWPEEVTREAEKKVGELFSFEPDFDRKIIEAINKRMLLESSFGAVLFNPSFLAQEVIDRKKYDELKVTIENRIFWLLKEYAERGFGYEEVKTNLFVPLVKLSWPLPQLFLNKGGEK